MKRTIRILAAAMAVVFLLVSLSACGRREIAARDRLFQLLALFGDVPAGVAYFSPPQAGDGVLSERLTEALYKRSDGYLEYGGRVAEAAVYLGSAEEPFFEAGVFVCYGSADTRAILEMCMRRARLVASVRAVEEGDIALAVSGRTVVYVIAREVAAAEKALDKLF